MKAFGRVVAGVALVGCAVFGGTATALADPVKPPNCTAADLAGVMAGVAAATSVYLHTHPDTNYFFTGLEGTPKDQLSELVQGYLDVNPQVRAELTAIRQPAVDFRSRCGVTDPAADPEVDQVTEQ